MCSEEALPLRLSSLLFALLRSLARSLARSLSLAMSQRKRQVELVDFSSILARFHIDRSPPH